VISDTDHLAPPALLPPPGAPRLPDLDLAAYRTPAVVPGIEPAPTPTRPVDEIIPNPAPATEEERRAARERAQRQMQSVRRKDRAVGWAVAVFVLAVAGALGWFGYGKFQEGQEADRAAREARQPTTLSDDELLGRLAQSVVTVPPVVDAPLTTVAFEIAPPPEQAGPLGSYSGVQYLLEFDGRTQMVITPVAHDVYIVVDEVSPAFVYHAVDAEWVYHVPGDGQPLVRTPRSDQSKQPIPDLAIHDVVDETTVLPTAARPYSIAVTAPAGFNRQPTANTLRVYEIDLAAYRAADPAGAAEWLQRWRGIDLYDPALIEPTGQQHLDRPDAPQFLVPLRLAEPGLDRALIQPAPGKAVVAWIEGQSHAVSEAIVVAPDEGVSVRYVSFGTNNDDWPPFGVPAEGWFAD
jgi:hypothetical protein